MNDILNILVLFISLGTSFFYQLPTQMPEEIAINRNKQQCAKVIMGDECMTCSLPAGWKIIGHYLNVDCPAGYEMVDLALDCVEKENCEWDTGPSGEVQNTPNIILFGSIIGFFCCGLAILVVVTVLIILLLRRRNLGKVTPPEIND